MSLASSPIPLHQSAIAFALHASFLIQPPELAIPVTLPVSNALGLHPLNAQLVLQGILSSLMVLALLVSLLSITTSLPSSANPVTPLVSHATLLLQLALPVFLLSPSFLSSASVPVLSSTMEPLATASISLLTWSAPTVAMSSSIQEKSAMTATLSRMTDAVLHVSLIEASLAPLALFLASALSSIKYAFSLR